MSGRTALIVLLAAFVAAVMYDAFEGRAGDYSKPHHPLTLLPAKSGAGQPSGARDSGTEKKDQDNTNMVRLGAAASTDTAESQNGEDCQQDGTSLRADKTAAKLLAAQAQVVERGIEPEQIEKGCKPRSVTEDVYGTPPY